MGHRESLADLDLITDAGFARLAEMTVFCVRSWVAGAGIAHFVLEGTNTVILSRSHAFEVLRAKKSEPDGVSRSAKQALTAGASSVETYVAERTARVNYRTPSFELYRDYVRWCGGQSINPASKQMFGRTLTKLGYPTQVANQRAWKVGIELADRVAELNRQKEEWTRNCPEAFEGNFPADHTVDSPALAG